MPICLRCGERFRRQDDANLPICPKCIEYERDRGFIACRGCNTLLESDEIIDGLCPTCLISKDEDETDDDMEVLSFEELEDDELEDDFDN